MSAHVEITVKEAAELTGFSEYWLRSLAKRRIIQGRLVGGPHRWYWRISEESILEYAKEMNMLGTRKHSQ